MSSPRVSLVPTGVANLASVAAAFQRLGSIVDVLEAPEQLESAARLVLPGVGSFASGMQALAKQQFIEPLRRRIAAERPTLAICLGLQLLCRSSEESPGIAGLGVLPVDVRRLAPPQPDSSASSAAGQMRKRVPHLGWNRVRAAAGFAAADGEAYFAHSYYLPSVPADWTAAWCTYDETFVAAAQRGAVWGCQFHPELSGTWGGHLLRSWLQLGGPTC